MNMGKKKNINKHTMAVIKKNCPHWKYVCFHMKCNSKPVTTFGLASPEPTPQHHRGGGGPHVPPAPPLKGWNIYY